VTEPDHGLSGRRRVVVGVALGVLALTQVVVGAWALFAPQRFYAGFPAAGHTWVALLPPFNEHLVRDVGSLSLAVAVVLAVAAVVATRTLVRTAVGAFSVYAVPHTVFHGLHLESFARADAVAQMAGFGLQLLLALVALIATFDASRRVGERA
jgi:hypothetical protein